METTDLEVGRTTKHDCGQALVKLGASDAGETELARPSAAHDGKPSGPEGRRRSAPVSRSKPNCGAGRQIWITGHVSLTESGLHLDGTGDRDLFHGRSSALNTDRRSLFDGDHGPFTDNVALLVKGQELRLQMSRRGVRDLLEAVARPKPPGSADEAEHKL